MCGIVGFINADRFAKFGEVCRSSLEQLLYADTQRGADGTGVVSINGIDPTPIIYKNAMWAPDYLQSHSYRNILKRRLEFAHAAIGHNRATTRSSISNENAHPFTHKHITLVHNGVIPNHNNIVPKDIGHEVDSFAAAYNIAEKGEQEGLETCDFKGVLVWWNDEDKTINMARNEHRELWCVPIQGHNALFWASEWRMLDWVLDRHNLIPETKYKILTPWMHFKFEMGKPKEWTRTPFQHAPETKGMNPTRGSGQTQQTAGTAATSSVADAKSGSKAEVVQAGATTFNPLVTPRRADQITEAELSRIERTFGRLSAKEKRKAGIPDNRHKLRKVCAKISNAQLDSYFGQRFVVYPDAFIPYKNQKSNGVITGTRRDTNTRVEIPNSAPEDFDSLQKDKWQFGTVVNAKKGKTGWHLICAMLPLDTYKDADEELDEPEKPEEYLIPGPQGQKLSLAKFQAMTQNGCANCTGFVNPNNYRDMSWFASEPICHICATDESVCKQLGLTPPKSALN